MTGPFLKDTIGLVLFGLLVSVAVAQADCIGCFDVIKVRAELTDGSSRVAYLVHYQSSSPLFKDSDSSLVVTLTNYDTSQYYGGKVPLLNAIYQFEGITTATMLNDIDSVEVRNLIRLVYLEDMKFGAWGELNVYPPRVIELLRRTPSARYDHQEFTDIYLSYDPEVTEQDLAILVEYRKWEEGRGAALRENLRFLGQQTEPALSDYDLDCSLSSKLNVLYERLFKLRSVQKSGPVGDYLETIGSRIEVRIKLLTALRTRFDWNWYDNLPKSVSSINSVLKSSGCDTTNTLEYLRNGNVDSLLCRIADCSELWLDNENDYIELLQHADIIEVNNGID